MEKQAKIGFEEFQTEVWSEYKFYRGSISAKEFENELNRKREESKGSFWRWFAILFTWFFSGLMRKAMKKVEDGRNYTEFEKEAYELRSEPEIRQEICDSIANLKRYEVLTEEKFVRILTATILQPKLVKKFVIPQDAVLYGIIAYQVFQTGLENYCSQK